MNKILSVSVVLVIFLSMINSGYGFIPLMNSHTIISQTINGFCQINNQTTTIVKCGTGNATLNITHGKGITVLMFPANSTMWINGTGSTGATGATGATGPQGPPGQVHGIIAGVGISINGSIGTVTISNTGVISATGSLGNVTVSASSGAVSWNLGNLPVIINGAAQTITKKITINQLFLGGNENASNFRITNLGRPLVANDAARENTIGNQTMSPYGNPTDQQVLTFQGSNNTAVWANAPSSNALTNIVVYQYLTTIVNYTTPSSATGSSNN